MRNTKALAALVSFVALSGLATIANATTAPPADVAMLDPSASPEDRALAMLAQVDPNFEESTKTTMEVPAGFSLVGRVVDGEWVVGVEPSDLLAPPSVAMGLSDGAGECYNDDAALYSWPGSVPTHYPMSPNLLWPAVRNAASQGMCNTDHTFSDPITYFQFTTAGDFGGAASIVGWDWYRFGSFSVACVPAGMRLAVGVWGEWADAGMVDDAMCVISQYDLKPSSFLYWAGTVSNYNTKDGMSTHAVAY